jgi:hypothetical protein
MKRKYMKWLRLLVVPVVLAMLMVIPLGQAMGANAHSVEWVKQFGSTTTEHINAGGTDGLGYAYVTGDTSGSINGQAHIGSQDAFVIKYNTTGGVEWTREFGTTGTERANGVAGDGSGNVYVVGITDNNLIPGGHVGGRDGFIRKYNSAGVVQWTDQFGSTNNDECWGVAVDSAGNAYIVGIAYNPFDGQTIIGSGDAYIVKYNSAGVKQWTRLFGTGSTEYGYGVAVDSYSNAYVTGQTSGTFPGETKTGVWDAYIRKYASNGDAKWTCQWGISGHSVYPAGIASDAYGNTYAAGYNNGAFPGETPAGVIGGADAFVSRITNAGDLDWNRQFGTSEDDRAQAIATDASGNAFVSGYTQGALPGQTYGGNQDAFAREYDSSGFEHWTYQYTTTTKAATPSDGIDEATGIATDGSGNVFVAGTVNGHFPGFIEGSYDGYMMKMAPPASGFSQVWYLDNMATGPVMEHSGMQTGRVAIEGTAVEVTWSSDFVATSPVVFDAGTWTVFLNTIDLTGSYKVQIGESDGSKFTGFDTAIPGTATGTSINLNIPLSVVTVPKNHYLALQVTNTGTGNVLTYGSSYLGAPPSTPVYPVPELAAIILLGLGLAGLTTFIIIRRRKAKAAQAI